MSHYLRSKRHRPGYDVGKVMNDMVPSLINVALGEYYCLQSPCIPLPSLFTPLPSMKTPLRAYIVAGTKSSS